MSNEKEIINCPYCNAPVSVIKGFIATHERGLSYTPYKLYHNIKRITGQSVRIQAKNNKCIGSRKKYVIK